MIKPHGYLSRPDQGLFYSLVGDGNPPVPAGTMLDRPAFRIGEHVARWSGAFPPPPIGTRVRVTMNKLGAGTVVAYFIEADWLGVEVKPDPGQRPEWHIEQNGDRSPHYLVFGIEFQKL